MGEGIGQRANLGHRAKEVEQQIDTVAADIGQGTAARQRRVETPAAMSAGLPGIEAAELHSRLHNLADRPSGKQVADSGDNRIKAPVVGHPQAYPSGEAGSDHLVTLSS